MQTNQASKKKWEEIFEGKKLIIFIFIFKEKLWFNFIYCTSNIGLQIQHTQFTSITINFFVVSFFLFHVQYICFNGYKYQDSLFYFFLCICVRESVCSSSFLFVFNYLVRLSSTSPSPSCSSSSDFFLIHSFI